MRSKTFETIIIELVDYHRADNGHTLNDVASILNVREDYVRKINSRSSNHRYSLEQLYLLSKVWNLEINAFLPSNDNLSLLLEYKDLSDGQLKKIHKQILNELKGE